MNPENLTGARLARWQTQSSLLARAISLGLACGVALAFVLGFVQDIPGAPMPPAVLGDAKRGQRLMATYQCGSCHDIPGAAAARGTSGPPLKGVARRSYIAGEVPNRPGALQRWIMDPASLVPGTSMPALGVTARDAQDIVAYLATLG